MRIFLRSLFALCLASSSATAATVELELYAPCEAVDEAAYNAFEPELSLREPQIDAFGFSGEVRGPKDGRVIVQLQFGSAVAWFDGPAKAKVTHKESGDIRYFISKVGAGKSDSLRLILAEGKIECGWPPQLR